MGGRDKAFVALAGRPLVDHLRARLLPQVGALAINANGDPTRFGKGRVVLPDEIGGRPGPLAGVLAAMVWAEGLGAVRVITAPVDCPFLPDDLVERLCAEQADTGASIVLAATGGRRHPVVGLWRVGLAGALRDALMSGTRRVSDFVEGQTVATVAFDEVAMFNVNTPGDLAEAEAILARRGR